VRSWSFPGPPAALRRPNGTTFECERGDKSQCLAIPEHRPVEMFRRCFAFIAGIEGVGGFDILMTKHLADDFVLAGVRLQEISRREVTRQMRVELSTRFARDDGGQGSSERTRFALSVLDAEQIRVFRGHQMRPETGAVGHRTL
jgi:hypothetical protein